MIKDKLKPIIEWCNVDNRIKALILVGSYARGEEKPDSDIDLVLVTDNKESLLELDWIDKFGKRKKYNREEYGACTSIRVFYLDDTEIEYGIVDTSWLSYPLDKGTRKVLEDGYEVLFESNMINHNLIEKLLKQF